MVAPGPAPLEQLHGPSHVARRILEDGSELRWRGLARAAAGDEDAAVAHQTQAAQVELPIGAGHQVDSAVAIPFAFPKAGDYTVWVQVKRAGRVETAAFDITVR